MYMLKSFLFVVASNLSSLPQISWNLKVARKDPLYTTFKTNTVSSSTGKFVRRRKFGRERRNSITETSKTKES